RLPPGRHSTDAPDRRSARDVRPLWDPRAGGGGVTILPQALCVAPDVRPHVDHPLHRDALRPPGTDPARRERRRDAPLLQLPACDLRDAAVAAAGSGGPGAPPAVLAERRLHRSGGVLARLHRGGRPATSTTRRVKGTCARIV